MAEKQYRLEEVIQTQHKDRRGRDMGTSVVRLFVPTEISEEENRRTRLAIETALAMIESKAYGAPVKVQLL